MKIWKHIYSLEPLKKLNAVTSENLRSGALLKIEWSLGKTGYSDLFPWPEFGDPELGLLLENLAQGEIAHPLIERSLIRNSADAWARSKGRSLFQSLQIPENHGLLFSLSDLPRLQGMGFKIFKLKMSGILKKDLNDLKGLRDHLKPSEKLRLDFNGTLSVVDFKNFCESVKDDHHWIDLIEDAWKPSLRKNEESWQIPQWIRSKLAGDFEDHPLWPNKIIKSARRDFNLQRPLTGRQICTHSMDHPVGQAFSLWEASRFERFYPHRKDVHGVARPGCYKSTDFDWAWEGWGPRPAPPKGLGIGFDEVFKNLKWERL